MINTSKIFEKKFLDTNINEIISCIRDDGVYFFKGAIDKNFIDQFLNEINENKFSINKNWTTGVYTSNQYYVKHLLGCSKQFYNLISHDYIHLFCKNFFEKDYRLKAFRYYETYSNHHMAWHTDNKISKKKGHDIFKEIPGIIFIVYLDEVNDGEFQFIKKTHKISNQKAYNDYSDQFISENYNNDILSFKGGKGDIVIYDTYGIHRAKKVINSNFVRKSLFFQIDTNLNSAEPSLVNPSFFDSLNQKQSQFFGFGLKNESDTYPITNFKTLPFKISLKYFSNYLNYKVLKFFYKFIPNKIRNKLKEVFIKK